jgi:hypothetical protein
VSSAASSERRPTLRSVISLPLIQNRLNVLPLCDENFEENNIVRQRSRIHRHGRHDGCRVQRNYRRNDDDHNYHADYPGTRCISSGCSIT